MQFRDLKQNFPVFILNKQDLTITKGKVVATSFPHMDMGPKSNMGGQMVVDVTIESDGKSATYVMPENGTVTMAGSLVLSTTSNGLVHEIESMKSNAEQILASVDYQRKVVEKSDEMLAELNPAYKEKQATEKRFGEIEGSISEMKNMMKTQSDMIESLVKALKGD